jgi:hypothetical protein
MLLLYMGVAFLGFGQGVDRFDHAILTWFADRRTESMNKVFRQLQHLGAEEVIRTLRWATLLICLGFRRFRHLLVFLGAVLLSTWLGATVSLAIARLRPYDIGILGHWQGFSDPSRVMIDASVALVGILYAVLPRGRLRDVGKWLATAYLVVLAVSLWYLAVENPIDSAFGLVLGVTISLVGFRVFVPDDIFPVRYSKGKAAHLDVGGRRGEAIRQALSDQLSLDVSEVKPFGLDGSSGSTPLKIKLADGSPPLFGKLYATTHLRADRSYKLVRTLLYGRLEDESTFSTVRRLIQYEDYLLRLAAGAGLPTARPYGFAEITPEREYLLVTEFFDGAQEIGDAEVTDEIIDDGLRAIRQLWTAGIAHRDIKPANILVRDGKVLLIDVAFAEVRPSPWREAVDLANMMLVLALRTDPQRVYERACAIFTPDEIGEAFAATRGLTLTSQLRAQMKQDGRDLIGEFRMLAPHRTPIRIQRWSVRRITLTIAVAFVLFVSVGLILNLFLGSNLV